MVERVQLGSSIGTALARHGARGELVTVQWDAGGTSQVDTDFHDLIGARSSDGAFRKVANMARSKQDNPEQIPLIDVDDPAFKEVKKQIVEYEALKEENRETASANNAAEKQKRRKLLETVIKAGVQADSDGAYHFKFSGSEWILSQESQLKVKKRKVVEESE